MTRKNYIGIAGAVSDALYHITHGLVMPNTAEERRARRLGLETVILMLCKELQADNDRFDAERFTEACGLHDTKHGLIVRYAKRHGVEVPNE